jgi:hypothetical protein
LIVQITRWTNAAAMMIMIMSGLEIHNAYPALPFKVRVDVRRLAWRRDAMAFRRYGGVVYVAA